MIENKALSRDTIDLHHDLAQQAIVQLTLVFDNLLVACKSMRLDIDCKDFLWVHGNVSKVAGWSQTPCQGQH